ncbi:hypothetical protein BSL78_24586 [Apostichopus japonicus]|uniref:Uncharacterized protein n=1 Tax=Stichopus japonicus TaxID=307972 RepID=A0A2G8JS91_STIJA|nr:hypothetical protein BSL78_24586 [Apostichopus japonicus]
MTRKVELELLRQLHGILDQCRRLQTRIDYITRNIYSPQGFAPATTRSNIAAKEYDFAGGPSCCNWSQLLRGKESFFAGNFLKKALRPSCCNQSQLLRGKENYFAGRALLLQAVAATSRQGKLLRRKGPLVASSRSYFAARKVTSQERPPCCNQSQLLRGKESYFAGQAFLLQPVADTLRQETITLQKGTIPATSCGNSSYYCMIMIHGQVSLLQLALFTTQ